jgi:hypothetical protein
MTQAENSKINGRDDGTMIYEMYWLSQYTDGSVLECVNMQTFTAQEVVDGACDGYGTMIGQSGKAVIGDLRRNAKAAIKNGTTSNLAPRVQS